MLVVAFATLVVISNETSSGLSKIKSILVAVYATRNGFRNAPDDHFQYGIVRQNALCAIDKLSLHVGILDNMKAASSMLVLGKARVGEGHMVAFRTVGFSSTS